MSADSVAWQVGIQKPKVG